MIKRFLPLILLIFIFQKSFSQLSLDTFVVLKANCGIFLEPDYDELKLNGIEIETVKRDFLDFKTTLIDTLKVVNVPDFITKDRYIKFPFERKDNLGNSVAYIIDRSNFKGNALMAKNMSYGGVIWYNGKEIEVHWSVKNNLRINAIQFFRKD